MLSLALPKHRIIVHPPGWLHSELDWEVNSGRKESFNYSNFHCSIRDDSNTLTEMRELAYAPERNFGQIMLLNHLGSSIYNSLSFQIKTDFFF